MGYDKLRNMPWKKAVKAENQCSIVHEISDGWWLFEKKNRSKDYYEGILGWSPIDAPFFVKHNPQDWVEYYIARGGYEQDKNEGFYDGRQIKWITRSFLPPLAREYAKKAIKQIGALNDEDISHLERIHLKLEGLLSPGSKEHRAAMRVAKINREQAKKKWNVKKIPTNPKMPKNVSATVNFLNGNK